MRTSLKGTYGLTVFCLVALIFAGAPIGCDQGVCAWAATDTPLQNELVRNNKSLAAAKNARAAPEKRRAKVAGSGDPRTLFGEVSQSIRRVITDPARTSRRGSRISDNQYENLKSLRRAAPNENRVRVQFNESNGTPVFIRTGHSNRRDSRRVPRLTDCRRSARRFMSDNQKLLKLADPEEEMVLKKEWTDDLGLTHFRFQQTYQGVPIWARESLVHVNADESVYLFHGRYEPSPELEIPVIPDISEGEAIEAAAADAGLHAGYEGKAELVIHTASDGELALEFKVDISAGMDVRWIYFIDASDGSVRHRINNLKRNIVTDSGIDLNGINREFNAWSEAGETYLVDPGMPLADPPYAPIPQMKSKGNTYILTANNSDGSFMDFISKGESWDPTAVSTAYHLKTIHDYYKNTFGRNGIDDGYMNYLAVIHFKENYADAFWNGQFVVFGDGDGQRHSNLAASLDITAHEIQHGITQHTAGLIYENQSGALNEAYSDIFACMVDRDDWSTGEGVAVNAPFVRSLEDPSQGMDSLPSKMSEYVNLPNTEAGDHGGVHINMTIPAHAAYLIAEGLSVKGLGTSIGRAKTEQIFYRALTHYLTASSQFVDARNATIQSAQDLYGPDSVEAVAVQAAWDHVEVWGGSIGAPVNQDPTDVVSVEGQDIMVYLQPVDGTHNPKEIEDYDLYYQIIPQPFTGYDPDLDSEKLNQVPVSYTRPAVYTDADGTIIFYVGTDYNLYSVSPNGTGHQQITTTGEIFSVAVSPDGRYFAYTSIHASDNKIYVGNLQDFTVNEYPVIPPDDIAGDAETMNTVVYADSLAFDYSGNTLVFDFLNCLSTPQDPCFMGGGFRYWSIGFLNLTDGSFDFPFPNQNPDYDISYPSFAYNNDYIVVLDTIDYTEYSSSGTINSGVWTLNRLNQTRHLVADSNLGTDDHAVFGVPSFWGDDDYLTIQMVDATNGWLYRVPIDDQWGSDPSQAELLNSKAAAMPMMHRAAVRDLTAVIAPSANALSFTDVNPGETRSQDLTLTNTGDRDVRIYHIDVSGSTAFSHNGINALLPRGGQMTIQVRYTPEPFVGGSAASLEITSDADTPQLSISLVGNTTMIPGDINGDGEVDLADAITALKVVVGHTLSEVQKEAELTGDLKIGLADAVALLRQISGG